MGCSVFRKKGQGFAWLETVTLASLLDAGNFLRALTDRQGQQLESPDEIAFEIGWIDVAQLHIRAKPFGKNDYGSDLNKLASSHGS